MQPNPIVIFDLISFFASFAAIFLLILNWKAPLRRDIKVLLLYLFIFSSTYYACLVVQWAGITKALDPLEDLVGALLPMWWAFVFYALFQETMEQDVRQSEKRYRAIVEDQTELICRFSSDGTVKFVNDAYCRYFNIKAGDLIGEKFFPLIPPEERQRVENCFTSLGQDNTVATIEHQVFLPSGEIRWQQWTNRAFLDDKNRVIELQAVGRDVTDRKIAVEALQESENRFRMLGENVPGVIYLCKNDSRWTMLFLNDAVEELTGYPKEDFLEDKRSFVDLYHPDDTKNIFAQVNEALASRNPFHFIYRIKHKNGQWRWVNEVGVGIWHNDELQMLEGYLTDITEFKRTEETLRQTLEEKETLLREVHHRVKNNLVLLNGLLHLQQSTVKDKKYVYDSLESAKSRIQSIGKVHQLIYQSKGVSEIDFSDYIREIVNEMAKTYRPEKSKIKIQFELEPILLDMDRAIPFGLIVNELLMNVFRHAFPGRREGTIQISLRSSDGLKTLKISDNGIGMPKQLMTGESETFGLKLIKMLTQQIKGDLQYIKDNGSTFVISIP